MESSLRVLLRNMAIVRNFKTTYGTTNLAQDEGVLSSTAREKNTSEFCPETRWGGDGGGGGGGVKL